MPLVTYYIYRENEHVPFLQTRPVIASSLDGLRACFGDGVGDFKQYGEYVAQYVRHEGCEYFIVAKS